MTAVRFWTGNSTPNIIAHRGAAAAAPENTIAAVHRAIADGATAIECDVQRTADGALVVIHDGTLTRTTDIARIVPPARSVNVASLTLAEVRALDAGSWFDISYAGQRVPTLAEWCNAIDARAGMLIELKHPSRHPGIERDLAELLRANQCARRAIHAGRLVVQSFDHDWLRERYAPLAGGIPLGALFPTRPGTRQLRNVAAWAAQANPRHGAVDRALVDDAHRLGLAVNCWTADSRRDMRRLLEAGVDGIITNNPGKLAALVGALPISS